MTLVKLCFHGAATYSFHNQRMKIDGARAEKYQCREIPAPRNIRAKPHLCVRREVRPRFSCLLFRQAAQHVARRVSEGQTGLLLWLRLDWQGARLLGSFVHVLARRETHLQTYRLRR